MSKDSADKKKLKDVVDDPEELLYYLKKKGNNHKYYKHYGRYESIKHIVEDRTLLLSDGQGWNDLDDGSSFSNIMDGHRRFGMCFTYSVSENMAMWLLYGGNDDGALINFSRSQIKDIIYSKNCELLADEKPLSSEYWDIHLEDVLYYGKQTKSEEILKGNSHCLKRSDETAPCTNRVLNSNACIKTYPWSYENEVRLIVTVKEDKVKPDIHALLLRFDDDVELTDKNVVFSPVSAKSPEKYNALPSTLGNTVKWDLCAKCHFKNKS